MSIRTFRKAIGLLFVDIVLIIGIFVLQFRTDSNIIEKMGNLQVTLSKKDNLDSEETQLMNRFRVSYNGVNFYSDEHNPVSVSYGTGSPVILNLESWEKISDLECVFKFSNNVNVHFELASGAPNASLAIIADFPDEYNELYIPYSLSSNMNIQKEDSNSVILNKRKETWEICASLLDSERINLRSGNHIATYSVFEETKEFTFDSIITLPISDVSVFDANRREFSENLINSFKANTSEANLSEQVVVSYIAAMAQKGLYTNAIESVPSSFKKSTQRTYLSAPYFNTLENMNVILDKAISSYEQKISSSAATGSLDIFTVHNIAEYMVIHSNPAVVKTLLQNTVMANVNSLSLAQATGIIQVFVDLYKLEPEYASILGPMIPECIDRIAQACAYDGNVLTISENDTFLSVIQAIETGVAVMRYGNIIQDETLKRAGYVIINSYLSGSASFDLRTLANLYPLLAFDNPYYPHFQKINSENGKILWAWTCAKDIGYKKDAEGAITLTIDFPEGATHYVIIKGLPRFSYIYIYNMQFRTDHRFETYNSSGYVYKDKFQTLLLKSRHKKQLEDVRFEYVHKTEPVPQDKKIISTENEKDVKSPEETPVKNESEKEKESDEKKELEENKQTGKKSGRRR